MQITLFKALRNADIPDDAATAVVDQLEEFIAVKITDANKGLDLKITEANKGLDLKITEANKSLEASLKSLEARLDAKISALTWLVGAVGVIVSVAALLASVLPLLHR